MAVTRSLTKPGHMAQGIQRQKLPVYDTGSETGNEVLTFEHPQRELYLCNDSTANSLTILIEGEAGLSLTFTLLPGETIDERFPEFVSVTVTATDDWRWYTRSGLIP